MTTINVALIGQGFMGRSHSNAWGQVAKFFKPPLTPVMHTVFGQPEENPAGLRRQLGLEERLDRLGGSWSARPEIGLVDIVTPNYMHAPVAKAAIAAGKAVACEKPIAGTLADAREMAAGRQEGQASRPSSGSTTAAARPWPWPTSWSRTGKIGEIRHVRAVYLQDWADESVPLVWRFDKKLAGSGAHGDLNAHIIDMTRFVTGQEITEICRRDRRDVHQEAEAADRRGRGRHRRRPARRPAQWAT